MSPKVENLSNFYRPYQFLLFPNYLFTKYVAKGNEKNKAMHRDQTFTFILLGMLLILPGCDIVAGIFAAGFWTATVLIIILIALIWWGVYKYRERD